MRVRVLPPSCRSEPTPRARRGAARGRWRWARASLLPRRSTRGAAARRWLSGVQRFQSWGRPQFERAGVIEEEEKRHVGTQEPLLPTCSRPHAAAKWSRAPPRSVAQHAHMRPSASQSVLPISALLVPKTLTQSKGWSTRLSNLHACKSSPVSLTTPGATSESSRKQFRLK